MNFITKKTSETGIKFQAFSDKKKKVFEAQKELSKKLGFVQWRSISSSDFGGISSMTFPDGAYIDMTLYKKVKEGEYMPRSASKEGKELLKLISALPTLDATELNECVGIEEPYWLKGIGFAEGNEEFFGFKVGEDWEFKAPNDCEEVTVSRYKELFNKNDYHKFPRKSQAGASE